MTAQTMTLRSIPHLSDVIAHFEDAALPAWRVERRFQHGVVTMLRVRLIGGRAHRHVLQLVHANLHHAEASEVRRLRRAATQSEINHCVNSEWVKNTPIPGYTTMYM